MAFKSRDLLDQLADLQLTLEGFSLQQLSVEEARVLKESFETFRLQLEDQLWKPGRERTTSHKMAPGTRQWDPDSLIASVSHDIRIPLNGIMGYAELLHEAPLAPGQRPHVEAIRAASKTLCGILDELLLYSRIRIDDEEAVEIPFNPREVLEEVSQYARVLLRNKPVSFVCSEWQEVPEWLIGDPSRLYRILINLLENAAKYANKGEVRLIASSVRRASECSLVLEVSDSGIGIPKGELPHIFKPYYQAKQGGITAGQGHGLGLSIVEKLIQQLGGSIEVQSKEGSGSLFRVRLPYRIGKGAVNLSAQPKETTPYGRELQGVRVLLFEDNSMNAKLMQSRLESWGCAFYHVTSVPKGMELLQERPVDLIIMDLRMPLMDGFQATRRIRNHRDTRIRRIPVLALTADITALDREAIRTAGIDAVMLKPYDSRELYAEMHRLSNHSQQAGAKRTVKHVIPGGEFRSNELSLRHLEEDCMGDIRLLEDMVRMLRANLFEFMGRMKLHIGQKDHKAITEASHKVISGLKLVRSGRLLRLAEEINQMASGHGDIQAITRVYGSFLKGFPDFDTALGNELNKRKNRGDGK